MVTKSTPSGLSARINPWVPGLHRYEPGKPLEEVAREYGFAADDAIKLASNENALGPSPKAIAAMQDAAASMHIYPDGGAHHLRQALAKKLDVDPDWILATNGSNEAIELLSHIFLGPGSNVVVGECAFVVYRLCAAASQAQTIAVPMRDHVHDLDAMAAAVKDDTRMVFVANPNNPTGTAVEPAALDALLEALPSDVLLVVDEAYIELMPEARRPDVLRHVRERRNVAVLRTFSKGYGLAGLRVGYAIAAPDVIGAMHQVRQPFNVNAMALAGAEAALGDEAYLDASRALVEAGLSELGAAFASMGLSYIPSCANFLCVDVGDGRRAFEALLQRGVVVRPMDVYGLPGHIRVTVGLHDENVRFLTTLKEIL